MLTHMGSTTSVFSLKTLHTLSLNPEFIHDYEIINELGSGGFGFVAQARHRYTREHVAVKFISKDRVNPHDLVFDVELGLIPLEASILKSLNHPNIIQFIALYQDTRFFYLVMEMFGDSYAKDESAIWQPRDIFSSIEKDGVFTEVQVRYIGSQLMSALSYLRTQHIHHRDIKDENVVIDKKLKIKLVDFGSAIIAPPKALFKSFRGTACYAPPEAIAGKPYIGELADSWSLGILLHTLLRGQSPFYSMQQTLVKKYNAPPCYSSPLRDLLFGLLEKDPSQRFNLIQIISHPFFHTPVISWIS